MRGEEEDRGQIYESGDVDEEGGGGGKIVG